MPSILPLLLESPKDYKREIIDFASTTELGEADLFNDLMDRRLNSLAKKI